MHTILSTHINTHTYILYNLLFLSLSHSTQLKSIVRGCKKFYTACCPNTYCTYCFLYMRAMSILLYYYKYRTSYNSSLTWHGMAGHGMKWKWYGLPGFQGKELRRRHGERERERERGFQSVHRTLHHIQLRLSSNIPTTFHIFPSSHTRIFM